MMKPSKVIRIDAQVWAELQRRARPLEDTPNSVLRRVLSLPEEGTGPERLEPRVIRLLALVRGLVGQMPQVEAARKGYAFLSRTGMVVADLRPQKERLRALFDADLSLVAYHLALDAHPEIGNNALLCDELGVERDGRFADGYGVGGRLPDPVPVSDLAERVQERLGRMPLIFSYGPELVERVAVCSGGAARYLAEAASEGYDCFLTGEAAEPTATTRRRPWACERSPHGSASASTSPGTSSIYRIRSSRKPSTGGAPRAGRSWSPCRPSSRSARPRRGRPSSDTERSL